MTTTTTTTATLSYPTSDLETAIQAIAEADSTQVSDCVAMIGKAHEVLQLVGVVPTPCPSSHAALCGALCGALAGSLSSAGRSDYAVMFVEYALLMSRKLLGDRSPLTSSTLQLAVQVRKAHQERGGNKGHPKVGRVLPHTYGFTLSMYIYLIELGLSLAPGEAADCTVLEALCLKCLALMDEEANSYAISPFNRAHVLGALSYCQRMMGNVKEALLSSRKAVACARTAGSVFALHQVLSYMKQFEEALPLMQEELSLTHSGHVKKELTACIESTQRVAAMPNRDAINVGHWYRMCNECWEVSESMRLCPCTKAWYCDERCQLAGWERHAELCNATLKRG